MRIVDVTGFRYNFGGQTSEYLIHNLDDSADTKYYGFVDFRGAWIIMKEVTSVTPPPEYFMGQIIQRHPDGVFVQGRNDTMSPAELNFETHGLAYRWVYEHAKRD